MTLSSMLGQRPKIGISKGTLNLTFDRNESTEATYGPPGLFGHLARAAFDVHLLDATS